MPSASFRAAATITFRLGLLRHRRSTQYFTLTPGPLRHRMQEITARVKAQRARLLPARLMPVGTPVTVRA